MNDEDIIGDLLRALGLSADDVKVEVVRVDDPDKRDPEKVVERFHQHYQGQLDRGVVGIEELDQAADILLAAADLSFSGLTKAGRHACDAFGANNDVESIAMDGTFAALVRMGFDSEVDAGEMSDLPDDTRGHLYLEGAQILRDLLGKCKLPEGTWN